MEYEKVKIKDVKGYEKNIKKHPESQVDKIALSIKTFGFNAPIILDKNNVIIAGHGRLLAAQKLGLKELPAIFKKDLTPAQVKAYRIADNKTAESDWEFDYLAQELREIMNEGLDIETTGFGKDELKGIIPDVLNFEEAFNSVPIGDKAHFEQITFIVSSSQAEFIKECVKQVRTDKFMQDAKALNENSNGNALWAICKRYYDGQSKKNNH